MNLQENIKRILREDYDREYILYRAVGLDEAIKSCEVGHLVYYSRDPMSRDWEVIEYGLGDEASEMSEEEVDEYVNDLVSWVPNRKGVNLTSDLDNAKGYSDIVLEINLVGYDYAEFSDVHIFAKNPDDCKIKSVYYNGKEYSKEGFIDITKSLQESIRRILREELETTPTKEKGEKMGTGDWALPYKNPMALIQKSPDDWDGLEGDDNGRLKFKEMKYGVRAGVKNLKNTYFSKGIGDTTLIDLFKKYAPSDHGANNPSNYADFVANKIGVKVTDKLSWDKYGKKISRSIINFETGIPIGGSKNKVNGVTEDEFETGYTLVNS